MTVLSAQCTLALQAATAAACAEALNAAPHSELWTLVISVVNPVIRAHAGKYMERHSCIARLPNELLLGIFEGLPIWDRVRAATVCHRWRTISLDAASALWSDIPHLDNVESYEPLLARARDSPVALTYSPGDLDDLESFSYTLSLNIGHVKSLRLILPDRDDDDEFRDAAEYLRAVLRENAPIMESLVFSDPGMMFTGDLSYILGSPMLQTIELKGFPLYSLDACAGSATIRNLRIWTPKAYSTLLSQAWGLLSQLPALEALSLHLLDVYNVDLPVHSPRLPQSVQHLCLEVHPALLGPLVRIEDLFHFQTLHVLFPYWAVDVLRLAALLPFLGSAIVSAAVHFANPWICLFAADGSGRKRVVQYVTFDDNWSAVFPNVTRLWLDGCHATSPRDPGTTAALFPALEELTLDATPPPSGSTKLPVWPALLCPRLRTVRIISETERPPLPASTVLGYLRRTLDSSVRLESLVFDGVTLSPTPGFDVDLGALADNVTMVQSGEVPSESYRVWADAW